MKKDIKEKFRNGMLPERVSFNRALVVSLTILILACAAFTFLIIKHELYPCFSIMGGMVVVYAVVFVVMSAIIQQKEIAEQGKKFRKIVDEMEDKDEYELAVLDYDFTIKVTSQGFEIDGETFGFDNFDVFLGSSNMCHQSSIAFFVVSNHSPFSDERTYPINFGIEGDSKSFACAKKYFFSPDYKAFNYLLEKPEESAKEILKYGLLKIQIEEQKKEKKLEKLAKELGNLD